MVVEGTRTTPNSNVSECAHYSTPLLKNIISFKKEKTTRVKDI